MDELNAMALVLSEHEDGSGRRLELQSALSASDQDRKLGQDTFCLVDEHQATHYGGIGSWALSDGILRVELSSEAAAALGVEGGFRLHLIATVDADTVSADMQAIVGASHRPVGSPMTTGLIAGGSHAADSRRVRPSGDIRALEAR